MTSLGFFDNICLLHRRPAQNVAILWIPGTAGYNNKIIYIHLKLPKKVSFHPPQGCVFSTRCPHAVERCRNERPELRAIDARQVACHFAERFLGE
jgi:dipeptide transport system ATP-binding protein